MTLDERKIDEMFRKKLPHDYKEQLKEIDEIIKDIPIREQPSRYRRPDQEDRSHD